MKQGIITLIPKPGKDPKQIDNRRPITLLNNDYTIRTHIYANRLKTGITQIISDTQSGFIRGRSIHNNIRLLLNLLDYNYLIEDKAFDSIEHRFMFLTLELFGLGELYKCSQTTLYRY